MDGHRKCYCGSYAELVGSMHTKTCYVRCPNCGARSTDQLSPFRAWIAWDNAQLQQDDINLTLYEVMADDDTDN
ncbi:MAG: hypothetical protein IIY21_07655 [Clostridiales bacterium]|nr:hypothetical protein [Clostridiales bacterium]